MADVAISIPFYVLTSIDYIPKAMVEAIKDDVNVPIQEYPEVAVVCM